MLLLDADGSPVANTIVLSSAAPEYAPPGQALVSTSMVHGSGPASLPDPDGPEVRAALARLHGTDTSRWERLRTYDLPHALPGMPRAAPAAQAGPAHQRRAVGVRRRRPPRHQLDPGRPRLRTPGRRRRDRRPGSGPMTGHLLTNALDTALDRTVVPGYSRIGFWLRRPMWAAGDPRPGSMVGKTVVVTGGSSGLGQATAVSLARLGATVHLVVRDLAKGRAAVTDIRGEVPGAEVCCTGATCPTCRRCAPSRLLCGDRSSGSTYSCTTRGCSRRSGGRPRTGTRSRWRRTCWGRC